MPFLSLLLYLRRKKTECVFYWVCFSLIAKCKMKCVMPKASMFVLQLAFPKATGPQ